MAYEVELHPEQDSRASFYGKARVRIEGSKKTLISYSTEVCVIQNGKAKVLGWWSATTARHIREFLYQNGFEARNSTQIKRDYMAKEGRAKKVPAETDSRFKTVAMVAMMGEIFGQTKKEKNDWKARMLKAGLGSSGLEMPEDWDTLSEDEKERRLNGVIKMAKGESV